MRSYYDSLEWALVIWSNSAACLPQVADSISILQQLRFPTVTLAAAVSAGLQKVEAKIADGGTVKAALATRPSFRRRAGQGMVGSKIV